MDNISIDLGTIDWKVILAAGSLIAAVFTILYFQWWRNRKRLSYEVISNVSVISATEEIRDEVEILYKSTPVKNVRLVVIKLVNDGYLPIKKEEFDNWVRFSFPKGKVLSAEKVKFHPNNLDTSIRYGDDWVEIDPTLFNRKDYVHFKVLVSTYNDEVLATARIVGISDLTKVNPNPLWREFAAFLIYSAILLPIAAFEHWSLSWSVAFGGMFLAVIVYFRTRVRGK